MMKRSIKNVIGRFLTKINLNRTASLDIDSSMHDVVSPPENDLAPKLDSIDMEDTLVIDTEEYKKVDIRVRKAVRLLLREGHVYDFDKFSESQEVIYALNGIHIPNNLLRSMILPLLDVRDWVRDEYMSKQLWTIQEASCLAVGMDPFIYEIEPGQFYNDWRDKQHLSLVRIEQSILQKELPAIQKADDYHVKPKEFCAWALDVGLLTSDLVQFLRDFSQSNEVEHELSSKELLARFITYAEQRLHSEQLSRTEERRRALYSFAVYSKYENPKLSREDIFRLAFNALSKECQKLSGLKTGTMRPDLMKLDQGVLIHPDYVSKEFLNSIPSDFELVSTDPTHHWWNQWRPVITKKLPWLELPK